MSCNIVENRNIDTFIRKVGISVFSGCIEHTCVKSQVIKEAKKSKKNFEAVWLDIPNADASVPYTLIKTRDCQELLWRDEDPIHRR